MEASGLPSGVKVQDINSFSVNVMFDILEKGSKNEISFFSEDNQNCLLIITFRFFVKRAMLLYYTRLLSFIGDSWCTFLFQLFAQCSSCTTSMNNMYLYLYIVSSYSCYISFVLFVCWCTALHHAKYDFLFVLCARFYNK